MSRVNIQYSVKLEDLKIETSRLLQRAMTALWHLDQIHGDLRDSDTTPLTLDTLERIKEIRGSLADIDYQLSDTGRIIEGYINYVTTSEEQKTPSVLTEQLEEVKQMVNSLKGDEDV